MKLKKIVSVCLNAEAPIKIIVKSSYFNGYEHIEQTQELDLIDAVLMEDREVESYEFTIEKHELINEVVCIVQMP